MSDEYVKVGPITLINETIDEPCDCSTCTAYGWPDAVSDIVDKLCNAAMWFASVWATVEIIKLWSH
jgi:hypothetical protein